VRRRRDLNPRSREGLLFSRSTQRRSALFVSDRIRRSEGYPSDRERAQTTLNETLIETLRSPYEAVVRYIWRVVIGSGV
jgi:hypothetical protein